MTSRQRALSERSLTPEPANLVAHPTVGGDGRRAAQPSRDKPRSETFSVVMPAHNEENYLKAAVENVLDGLRCSAETFEVLVVENGSTDDTSGVARALAEDHPEVRVLTQGRADYGTALRCGLLEASGDWVVLFDVDFIDLSFLRHAREAAAETGATIVVGSKRSPGSDDQRHLGRKAVTAVFSSVLRVGFGLGVSDTHGVKILHRATMAPIVDRSGFGGDIFDTELILRAEQAGLHVTEIPVTVREQRPPRTSILARIPRSLLGLARLRIALWRTAEPEKRPPDRESTSYPEEAADHVDKFGPNRTGRPRGRTRRLPGRGTGWRGAVRRGR